MQRYKEIRKETEGLLSQGENQNVDFKKKPDGVSADDLVAFANSLTGGNIIAGVDEIKQNGLQFGKVVGCDVGDGTLLQILNKAKDCSPPVAVSFAIENTDDKPILNIIVPHSPTQPHCTPKGIYCIRDGSRNRPIFPPELLRIFLDTEAESFASRFESVASKISDNLEDLSSNLEESISSMSSSLGWVDFQLDDTESVLKRVEHSATSAFSAASQAKIIAGNADKRLRSLLKEDNKSDPVKDASRTEFKNKISRELSKLNYDSLIEMSKRKQISLNIPENISAELSQIELDNIFSEMLMLFIQQKATNENGE